jgi:hypothetical protein
MTIMTNRICDIYLLIYIREIFLYSCVGKKQTKKRDRKKEERKNYSPIYLNTVVFRSHLYQCDHTVKILVLNMKVKFKATNFSKNY